MFSSRLRKSIAAFGHLWFRMHARVRSGICLIVCSQANRERDRERARVCCYRRKISSSSVDSVFVCIADVSVLSTR